MYDTFHIYLRFSIFILRFHGSFVINYIFIFKFQLFSSITQSILCSHSVHPCRVLPNILPKKRHPVEDQHVNTHTHSLTHTHAHQQNVAFSFIDLKKKKNNMQKPYQLIYEMRVEICRSYGTYSPTET